MAAWRRVAGGADGYRHAGCGRGVPALIPLRPRSSCAAAARSLARAGGSSSAAQRSAAAQAEARLDSRLRAWPAGWSVLVGFSAGGRFPPHTRHGRAQEGWQEAVRRQAREGGAGGARIGGHARACTASTAPEP
jgi:hypothetical protein